MNNENLILSSLHWLIYNTEPRDSIQGQIKITLSREINEVLDPTDLKEPCCDMDGFQEIEE